MLNGHSVVWSVCLLAVVSGCADTPAQTATTPGPDPTIPTVAGPADFGADTGAIEGVVLDEENRPLPGAHVALVEYDEILHQTTVDLGGRFSLSTISPASYTIVATQPGYETESRRIDVVAGQITNVHFLLIQAPTNATHVQTLHHRGFFDCSWTYWIQQVGLTAGATGPCGFTNAYNFIGNPMETVWTGNVRSWDYNVGPGVMTVLNELTWSRASMATGDKLQVTLTYTNHTAFHWYCRAEGVGPLTLTYHREGGCISGTSAQSQDEFAEIPIVGQQLQTYVDVGPGRNPVTNDDVPAGLGVGYQQTFEVWISVFYREKAPPEFTALPDA